MPQERQKWNKRKQSLTAGESAVINDSFAPHCSGAWQGSGVFSRQAWTLALCEVTYRVKHY